MVDYVIAQPPQAAVPVAGGGLFPVRRIYCVGRNYAEHAREMGHDPNAEPPFFFAKPADAVVTDGADVPYPPRTENFHHEIELVAAIGAGGKDIAVADAMSHVWGYAVGIDLTRRDLQAWAKKGGKPWEVSKGFDHSAPIGTIVRAEGITTPLKGAIELRVNGETRQSADISDMTWDLPHVIAELSKYFELFPGDLIMTGTPAGVGAVVKGDRLEGSIAGIGTVECRIV
ncbi:fumarylacetoacetate hydrolase family protein [Devosia sp. ZB163]|uniref:fumarylacetoacetate hydrolase family protein n=1 Tax=Devosia sp. ZB163 TaxID=3025938 RepID=UPI002360685B|nr:fumarylacetoacetate hydrolase family protein [Devosia sp. ZB163]MDC9822512.1 fumarylacetoacetate hydrolase family protein [Devosia sp. ZB163]